MVSTSFQNAFAPLSVPPCLPLHRRRSSSSRHSPNGSHGFTVHKEKFTKLDNEKRMKELEVIGEGYLDLGFTLFRVRFEIIEKDNDSCIIKSTIEYDVKEVAVANTSYANTDLVAKIAKVTKNYLIKNKATENAA
ncbi:norbelladine synthase isoform X2 [Quercus suber]|uniref:norbelladine synthase isoform X2 n=1 Tax=Quercus suber TaxID=58331 RepID=UPI0032DEA6E1